MLEAENSFEIFTEATIRQNLYENKVFKVVSPFFLLIKHGEVSINNEEDKIDSKTISVFSKEGIINFTGLSPDCECILIKYDRRYIRSMTLKLDLLAAFKHVYADSQPSFFLPTNDFNDLWFLLNFIKQQIADSQNSNLENHIFRHLNYSFLYMAIDKMNHAVSFKSEPRTQQEKLVLNFLKNIQEKGTSKLKVSDYARMQNVTTRHLSTTIKEITGMSALEIIHSLLYSHAKRNLTETDKPISEIAFELGFNDPYTFSHFFKKQNGLSPSEFRNNYQG
ncbi:AraC-type DNA-binding protein [Salegentibacter holothuriorum]|uniref:AraC-type DNA-binding protein n=1 Tax=Salegentibacter holothuriorum TaxID=241145 RepID=A0A1T5DIK5_9FLAO|nr:AraC family transcriptional regulator [Salegentibacter holothuriorum]SKB71568.1 AraC-type DNA-binding protein [Salegentibacter holothuriorum]